MIKIISKIAATVVLACAACSCNSTTPGHNGDPGSPTPYQSLVTFEAIVANGQLFTYRTGENTELITLESSRRVDTAIVKPGERLIIYYTLPEGCSYGNSGPINLQRYSKVLNTTLRFGTLEPSWNNYQLRGISVFRTGQWLNFRLTSQSPELPSQFEVLAVKAAADQGRAEIFLVTNLSDDGRPCYTYDIYGSVSLKPLLERYPDIHTATVYVPFNGESTFEISLPRPGELND